jgi:hypothetical protein
MNKKIVSVLLMLFMLGLACGGPTQIEKVTEVEVPEATEVPPTPTVYQLGDVIAAGDLEITVLGWQISPGKDFWKPEEGKIYLIVEVVLENKGDQSRIISPLIQMSLKDADDRSYGINMGASAVAGTKPPEGEILPGERLRGEVGFEVPETAAGFVFVFDPDIFGTGKVLVYLGDSPTP